LNYQIVVHGLPPPPFFHPDSLECWCLRHNTVLSLGALWHQTWGILGRYPVAKDATWGARQAEPPRATRNQPEPIMACDPGQLNPPNTTFFHLSRLNPSFFFLGLAVSLVAQAGKSGGGEGFGEDVPCGLWRAASGARWLQKGRWV